MALTARRNFNILQLASNDELIEDFRCTKCRHFITPPFVICTTGHIMCQKCVGRKLRCQNCSAKTQMTRSFLGESVFGKLTFPCRYRRYGCTAKLKGDDLRLHESTCEYYKERKLKRIIKKLYRMFNNNL